MSSGTKGNLRPQWSLKNNKNKQKNRQCKNKNNPRKGSNSAVRQSGFAFPSKKKKKQIKWFQSISGSSPTVYILCSFVLKTAQPTAASLAETIANSLMCVLGKSTSEQRHICTADDSCLTPSQAGEQTISRGPKFPRFSSTTEDVGLKLQQLAHEGQVGGDDLTPLLYKVKGLIQFDTLRVHQVSQTDGGRAGDTCLTVYQHPASALLHRVCKRKRDGGRGAISRISGCSRQRNHHEERDLVVKKRNLIHHKHIYSTILGIIFV